MNTIYKLGSFLLVVLIASCATPVASIDPVEVATRAKLTELANSTERSAKNIARNQYRHPVETLMFFGLRDDMTVVEVSPGSGAWYTEILGPMMRDTGTLYAGSYNPDSDNEYVQKSFIKYNEKMIAKPDLYDQIKQTVFAVPARMELAPNEAADMVLTFRSFHGWLRRGNEEAAMDAMYDALKPGGILGLVQHRMDEDTVDEKPGTRGYIKTSVIVAAAEAAGFELVASSEINANPLDTKDHPNGVWTLPPAMDHKDLNLSAEQVAAYVAIGESDRMTLKFVKPE